MIRKKKNSFLRSSRLVVTQQRQKKSFFLCPSHEIRTGKLRCGWSSVILRCMQKNVRGAMATGFSVFELPVLAILVQLLCLQSVKGQGKIAPLLPGEFAANMLQNKFNHNGYVVNHTCAGTYYSSHSQQMIRADCTATGYASNNQSRPTPFTSNIFLSLLDFTKTPRLSTPTSRWTTS